MDGQHLLSKPKDRKVATLLAVISALPGFPAGFHKFYMGQPWWGVAYALLSFTPIPFAASAFEAAWYLFQDPDEFDRRFNGGRSIPAKSAPTVDPTQVSAVATALREINQLREDGLISEYEFEQKRRQLLDQV